MNNIKCVFKKYLTSSPESFQKVDKMLNIYIKNVPGVYTKCTFFMKNVDIEK